MKRNWATLLAFVLCTLCSRVGFFQPFDFGLHGAPVDSCGVDDFPDRLRRSDVTRSELSAEKQQRCQSQVQGGRPD